MSELTVGNLLAEARVAHEEYRHAKPRFIPNTKTVWAGDPIEAKAAMARAYSARANAEMLDPETTDPAWQGDLWLGIHYDLLGFYLTQLAQ